MSVGLTFAAIATAAGTWWLATGGALLLARRRSEWHGTVSAALGISATFAVLLVYALRDDTTVLGVAAGFFCAIVVWAWAEVAFLLGHIVGPRREPCPSGVTDRRRFALAFHALRDHELVLVGALGLLIAVSWNAANTVAVQTFAVLWLCRLASKLCIFEGVPEMAHGLMPERLAHLKSYFGRGRPRVAFALSMAGMVVALLLLGRSAAVAGDGAQVFGHGLVMTLVALAMLEHALMVLPVRDERLWDWASRRSGREEAQDRPTRAGRELHGVALEARAVVPARRAP